MSAPILHPVVDGRDLLRDHIAELASVLIAHAENLQNYCAIRDDAGLMYSVRHVATYAKALIAAQNRLTAAMRHLLEAADGQR